MKPLIPPHAPGPLKTPHPPAGTAPVWLAGCHRQSPLIQTRSRVAVPSRCAFPKSQTGCGSAAKAGAAVTNNKRRKKTGDLGFEPRQTDPESVVLPLHQSPITACHYKTLKSLVK